MQNKPILSYIDNYAGPKTNYMSVKKHCLQNTSHYVGNLDAVCLCFTQVICVMGHMYIFNNNIII